MTDRSSPFFLLGAGFGVDAGAIVGPIEAESIYIGKYHFSCAYPLVRDLPRVCFPGVAPPVPPSEVEMRLADALQAGDEQPVDLLCQELARADYYLAPALVGWPKRQNPYSKFFSDFPTSSFATYNYDAFVEFALFRSGKWSPHDGFGVEVAVDIGFTAEPYELRDSECLVLHLHGTYLVYAYEHRFSAPDKHGVQWMQRFDTSEFAFDPHSLGSLFYPCERVMAGLAYRHELPERVVAPIPNKATGLKADFVRRVTQRAKELIGERDEVIVIGYAFAVSDKASYSEILESINAGRNSRVVLVAPEARAIVARLEPQYRNVEWVGVDLGFAKWVEAGYSGLAAV